MKLVVGQVIVNVEPQNKTLRRKLPSLARKGQLFVGKLFSGSKVTYLFHDTVGRQSRKSVVVGTVQGA